MSSFRLGEQEITRGKINFVDLCHYPTNYRDATHSILTGGDGI